MPAFDCRQCHREFISDEALLQHYKDSPAHPFCLACNKSFDSQDRLDAHNARNHPGFACTTCRQSFATQSSLEDHYRGKATIHPKCLRCGKGFLDRPAVAEHFKVAHPQEKCSCGREIFVEDRARHYTESTDHPSCRICNTSFKDDVACDEHGAAEHPEFRCAVCRRQFGDETELQGHFDASGAHPKCARCKTGFVDDNAFNEHLLMKHSPAAVIAPASPMPFKDNLEPSMSNALIPVRPAFGREGPSARLFDKATQDLVSHPQVDFRSSGATTNKTEAWKDLSNRNMGGLTAAPMTSPQLPASTWSFNPLVEQPDRPSDVKSGPHLPNRTGNNNLPVRSLAVSPPKGHTASQPGTSNGTISEVDRGGLPCMVCRGRCVDPTVTIGCGHVFCKKCVTKRIVEASACPKCAAPTLLYCLFRLHLDD